MLQQIKESLVGAGAMGMHLVRTLMLGTFAGVVVTLAARQVTDNETAGQIGGYASTVVSWLWFMFGYGRTFGVVAFLTMAVLAVGGYAMEITLRLQGRKQAADRLSNLIGDIVVERIEERR